jgi:hypothetical protein
LVQGQKSKRAGSEARSRGGLETIESPASKGT